MTVQLNLFEKDIQNYTSDMVSNQMYVMSQKQDLVRDELQYLEGLDELTLTEEVIEEFFGHKRIKAVPMFVESMKNYLKKGSASLSRSNISKYPDLHIVEDSNGDLIAYVYHRGVKTGDHKTPTDVFFDYFDNR